jgi:hypothetical protein
MLFHVSGLPQLRRTSSPPHSSSSPSRHPQPRQPCSVEMLPDARYTDTDGWSLPSPAFQAPSPLVWRRLKLLSACLVRCAPSGRGKGGHNSQRADTPSKKRCSWCVGRLLGEQQEAACPALPGVKLHHMEQCYRYLRLSASRIVRQPATSHGHARLLSTTTAFTLTTPLCFPACDVASPWFACITVRIRTATIRAWCLVRPAQPPSTSRAAH